MENVSLKALKERLVSTHRRALRLHRCRIRSGCSARLGSSMWVTDTSAFLWSVTINPAPRAVVSERWRCRAAQDRHDAAHHV